MIAEFVQSFDPKEYNEKENRLVEYLTDYYSQCPLLRNVFNGHPTRRR